MSSWLFKS